MKRNRWIGALVLLAVAATARAAEAPRWSISGLYLESCTCGVPCPCLIRGEAPHGCQGLNVWQIDSGRYGEVSLKGVRVAFGHQPGGWGIYYFAPGTTEAQQQAVRKILEPRDRAFGITVEAVKTAPIEIAGDNGAFTVRVGDVGRFTTQTVVGLDKRQPISYRNLPDPFLREGFQARSVTGGFKDAGHEFDLTGTNALWSRFRARS